MSNWELYKTFCLLKKYAHILYRNHVLVWKGWIPLSKQKVAKANIALLLNCLHSHSSFYGLNKALLLF